MKTIATAAVFLTLAASAWAEEPASMQASDPANTNEPIILSEAEMDGVTAGGVSISTCPGDYVGFRDARSSTSNTSRLFRFQLDMVSDNNAGAT